MGYTYDDFVNNNDFTFWFNALNPFDEHEHRTVAHFAIENQDVPLDLMVQSVTIDYKENNQVQSHLGETFSLAMFGKSPATVAVQATLLDSQDGYGKNELMCLYRDYLRPSAVARQQQMPELYIGNEQILCGPVVNMHLAISGQRHGTWGVSMTIQLMKYIIVNTNPESGEDIGMLSFDYTVGEDLPIRILRTNTVPGYVSETTPLLVTSSKDLDTYTETGNQGTTTTEETKAEETATEEPSAEEIASENMSSESRASANYQGYGDVYKVINQGGKIYGVYVKVTKTGAKKIITIQDAKTGQELDKKEYTVSGTESKKYKTLLQNYFENGPNVFDSFARKEIVALEKG